MRILSFPGFQNRQPGVTAQDWSQQEIADFYRAHRLLVANGAGIGLDRGLTDIGEPWMVFYDVGTQDVFMHVARIDGRCVLVCDQLDIRLSSRNITDLIADFESAIRRHLTIRAERNSNVILHPAAKIILSISAVFLLFKLDGGSVAHAKGFALDHQASEAIVRKSDIAANPRVQSTISRLLDLVDSPRAVAALAGVILTSELLNHPQNHGENRSSAEEVAFLRSVLIEKQPLVSEHNTSPVEQVAVNDPRTTDHPAHDTVVKAITSEVMIEQFFKEGFVSEVKQLEAHVIPASEPNLPAVMIASNVSVYHVPEEARTVTASSPASGDIGKLGVETSLSIQAVANLIGLDLTHITVQEAVNVTPSGSSNVVTLTPGQLSGDAFRVTDISISSLDKLDDVAGFSLHTSMADSSLETMIVHFLNAFDHYEVEYTGGKVLIEQAGIEGLKGGDIGIWTNMMSDGSSISIVGQANLLDNAVTLLS